MKQGIGIFLGEFAYSAFCLEMLLGKSWNFCCGERTLLIFFGGVFLSRRKKKERKQNNKNNNNKNAWDQWWFGSNPILDHFEMPFLRGVFFWENQWTAYLIIFFFSQMRIFLWICVCNCYLSQFCCFLQFCGLQMIANVFQQCLALGAEAQSIRQLTT